MIFVRVRRVWKRDRACFLLLLGDVLPIARHDAAPSASTISQMAIAVRFERAMVIHDEYQLPEWLLPLLRAADLAH